MSSTFQTIASFWFILILECCHQCYTWFFCWAILFCGFEKVCLGWCYGFSKYGRQSDGFCMNITLELCRQLVVRQNWGLHLSSFPWLLWSAQWLKRKELITELSRSVIFLKSSDTNAFTTQSPPRAPCASLLCECFLITNLTPQSKGSRPYSIPYTHTYGRNDKCSVFAAA